MTICLLPGLLCDETIWVAQRDALSHFGRVIIPDFRGAPSIEAMAQTVLEAAPERFAVAGHSMGGRVALEVLRMAPDRVDRLALLDTGIHPRRAGEAEKRQVLIDIARNEGMAAVCAQWLPPMLHRTEPLATLTAMVLRSTPESFARQQNALLNRPAVDDVLRTIQCPTLVLCGRQDAWAPVAQHEEIAAAIPHSKLVIVEDAGHMAPAEQPDAVTVALLDWSCHL